MTRLALLLALASGCAVVDVLDGHIDNRDHCCLALSADDIRECLLQDAPVGRCSTVTCPPPIGHIEAYLNAYDEIRNQCPDYYDQ